MTEQPAGRDLTKAVAETLGWTEIVWDDGFDQHVGLMPGEQVIEFVPDYAADPAAALEALERLDWGVVLHHYSDEEVWSCILIKSPYKRLLGEGTLAEAICRAILATREVQS